MNLKMIIVSYNAAIDDDLMDVMSAVGMVNFTKFSEVYGKGQTSGIHDGSDVWPGINNVLLAVVSEEVADRALEAVRDLRKKLGNEGVKAFILPVEAVS
ncbi:MAG: hypothetical protein JXN60_03120 [Lentisphaerae bacterium]|nr:hypothetical protein [Lentisphaerota bacterium]